MPVSHILFYAFVIQVICISLINIYSNSFSLTGLTRLGQSLLLCHRLLTLTLQQWMRLTW